jgi:integrase
MCLKFGHFFSIHQHVGREGATAILRLFTSISETFVRHDDAKTWGVNAERQIDRGETPTLSRVAKLQTFAELIDLHIDDMTDVGKPPLRSKRATLMMLKKRLGEKNMVALDRECVVKFGRARALEGAGPVTLSSDIGAIKLVLTHAAAVHGLPVSIEPVELARVALKRLGLIGKSKERDRRPTEEELEKIFRHFDGKPRMNIPMNRIIKTAIATAMRQEEICMVVWPDFEARTKMLTIRDRKDPREKIGNDQRIPLLAVSGYDAMALIDEQRSYRSNDDDRIFPFNHKSVSTLFTRACADLGIIDLHFHDLRHEGTSRLFEAGFQIHQVALVTGHKDWKMLRR